MKTQFAVTIDVTVIVFERPWNLTCTAAPKGWDCEPAVLWLENKGETPWVPVDVWEAVEDELARNSPARAAFDAAMESADVPFVRAAE